MNGKAVMIVTHPVNTATMTIRRKADVIVLVLLMSYTVYILYSPSLKRFYKGFTSDIDSRILYHNGGHEDFTKKGIPWTLCWHTTKTTKSDALKLEKKLKNLTNSRLIELMLKYNEDLTIEGQQIISGSEPWRFSHGDDIMNSKAFMIVTHPVHTAKRAIILIDCSPFLFYNPLSYPLTEEKMGNQKRRLPLVHFRFLGV